MNWLILISAVCVQIGWIYGAPNPEGVGVYAYQDSNGKSIQSIYPITASFRNKVRPMLPFLRPLPPLPPLEPLSPYRLSKYPQENLPLLPPLQPLRPLQPMQPLRPMQPLQPLPPLAPLRLLPFRLRLSPPWLPVQSNLAFKSNKEYQTKALDTAKKAYDITSNQAGFMNFDFSRFAPFNAGFGNFGMPNFGSQNSAYAAGMAMPGYSHQIAAISPANPNQPNVNVENRFGESAPNNGGYMSVSSSSYATSSNLNGQQQNHRGAETTVNKNGVVHHYKVEN